MGGGVEAGARRRRLNDVRRLGVGAVLGLVLLTILGYKHLTVREITVEGGERIQAEAVLQRFPIQIGMHWLAADTEAARQALLRLPDVRDVSVRRALWGRMRIILTERQPLMVAQLGKKLFWMDTEGFFYSEAASPPWGPVLIEPETAETERGRRLADPFYVVPLSALMNAPGDLLHRITTVRLEGSTMILSFRNGPDVLMNVYDVRRDLGRLRRIASALDRRSLKTLDLRFERVVVVGEKVRR